MYRTRARRLTVFAILALLWLAAGPAVAAVPDPSDPEESFLAALLSWVTGLWTEAGSEPSFEKTVAGGDSDSGAKMPDDPVIDKGVLIDPNGNS